VRAQEPAHDPALGRKRERDGEADREGAASGGGGLAPQKKPRLTFGGGLRGLSAAQALEKKKIEPEAHAKASPLPGSTEGGAAPMPPLELVSPLGGPLGEPEAGAPLSLGAAALEGEKKPDKPRLVFPVAAKVTPSAGGDERPKPKLTFGGGLGGAAASASSPATSSPGPGLDAPERRSSSGGLSWPAAATSGSSTPHDAMPSCTVMPPSQAPRFPPGAAAPCYYGGAPHSQGMWGEGMMEASRMHPLYPLQQQQQQLLLASALAPARAARSPRGTGGLSPRSSAQSAPPRGAGVASYGAAHLEALSDSDGEGSGQGKCDQSPRSVPAS